MAVTPPYLVSNIAKMTTFEYLVSLLLRGAIFFTFIILAFIIFIATPLIVLGFLE